VLEQRLRLEQRRSQREEAEEFLDGIGARRNEIAGEVETLAENSLGVARISAAERPAA